MIVIFTDLDGCLLDKNYSYKHAKSAIDFIINSNIPIVICSSKTRAEIEFLRKEIGIKDPFIVENGAAIFIPHSYFGFPYQYSKVVGKYKVIELGTKYSIIRRKLKEITEMSKCKIIGFGDMSTEELAIDCGLSLKIAKLAKKREYDEPFKILDGKEENVIEAIKKCGLNYTKGDRYYHLIGNNNKGKAVEILIELYKTKFGEIKTVALGSSINDLSMLEVVDTPFLVKDEKEWRKVIENIFKFL
ncbi:MAG: mannosyl-3-phosphoglycerate phosphatase [Thermoplasmatales archaeon]|nr:mannosyl-3-phosphoglycerate phosphatase [Thermoplasmatales archaeon]